LLGDQIIERAPAVPPASADGMSIADVATGLVASEDP
jgi:hypothetical protein